MIRRHRLHAYLRAECGASAGLRITRKGDAGCIGRPARRERNSVELRQLVLIFAVVIHRPDFLIAAAIADERNLRAGDSRQAARKFADDLIGELVSEDANLRIGCVAAIHLADNGRERCVADVIQPGLDLHTVARHREIAESEQLRRRRGVGPGLYINFARRAGGLQRVITLADHFEDAAEIQVRAHDLAELHALR